MNEFSHPAVHANMEQLKSLSKAADKKLRSWSEGREFLKSQLARAIEYQRRHADRIEAAAELTNHLDRVSIQFTNPPVHVVKRLMDNGWLFYRGEGWYAFQLGEQIVDSLEVAR